MRSTATAFRLKPEATFALRATARQARGLSLKSAAQLSAEEIAFTRNIGDFGSEQLATRVKE